MPLFRFAVSSLAIVLCPSFLAAEDKPAGGQMLTLHARRQVETAQGTGRYHSLTKPIEWDAKQTAIVICDMWDKHWCQGATRRVAEMAPRMNEVVAAARKRGVLIIHCPSDTMDFYKDTPQRKLAQQAPKVETKVPLERWCRIDPKREGNLPIDDRDGGCDCSPTCKNHKAWTRQIATIEIAEGDAITDSAEAYYLMRQRGINNVIVMGVHTNMCVLGRPFSIRQMVYQGQNVVLDARPDRHHVQLAQRPEGQPFHRHRPRRRAHRAALVPDDHEHGLCRLLRGQERRQVVPLLRRQTAAPGHHHGGG